MRFLFVHQNFPAQFKHLAPFLASMGHEVHALTMRNFTYSAWQGIKIHTYSLTQGNTPNCHPWAKEFESKVLRGEGTLKACLQLKQAGLEPDVIIAHPGWGESLFLNHVWSKAKLKLYYEWFYHAQGFDVGFDKEFQEETPQNNARVELKNATTLLSSEHAYSGLSPTNWQRNTFPTHIRPKISVIHDGIDTSAVTPNPEATLSLGTDLKLTPDLEILTFVSRTLEPYRGFHTLMRSLPAILTKRPNAYVLIVGGEQGGYGSEPPERRSWKQIFGDEIASDLSKDQRRRICFMGQTPYETYLKVLQVSSVHVYLTYPFVLGWSLLEAMSAGCRIVASDTPPVLELMTHEETGFLIDFFDAQALSESCIKLLQDRDYGIDQSVNARDHIIRNYDLRKKCLPGQAQWALTV